MSTYFASDIHFSHRNIDTYCDRGFEQAASEVGQPELLVETMNSTIIDMWNEVVDAEDEVWVLGDVAMGKFSESLPLVAMLNGKKILVPGNHDRCWMGHRKNQTNADRLARHEQAYLDAGFERIEHDPDLLAVGDHQVALCHFPYSGDHEDKDRFPTCVLSFVERI